MLSAEDKQLCKELAENLKGDDPSHYMHLRELTKKGCPEEAEMIMAIIFHLLPPSARDHVAVEFMTEAMDAKQNR